MAVTLSCRCGSSIVAKVAVLPKKSIRSVMTEGGGLIRSSLDRRVCQDPLRAVR